MRIVVVGAGVMGHGIAEIAALAGYETTLVDISDDILSKALQKIEWSLKKFVEKKRISEEQAKQALGRIKTTTDLAAASRSADVVIEAVPEDINLKKKIFATIDANAPAEAILATNTSTLPISEIASATKRPEYVVGMHFFNPPPLMPLVEVIRGEKTSDDVIRKTAELAKSFGKEVVICHKDVPGFIVNRIVGPLLNEACWMVHRGEATPVEIDSAVRYKAGLPMGLLELADYTGIDVTYLAGESVRARDPANVLPCPLFKEYYEKGKLGQKSGEGFYKYGKGMYERPSIPREAGEKLDIVRIMAVGINAAAWLVRNGVASTEDVERAVKLGLGFPKGILEMADEWGIDRVVAVLNELREKYGDYYAPDPLLTKLLSEGKLGVKAGAGFHNYATGEKKYSEILVKKEGHIAWVILNRPQRLNALTLTMADELIDALDKLTADGDVRVIVLRGAGDRAFSAGADVTAFTEVPAPHAVVELSQKFQAMMDKVEATPKPVIAAIDGFALGGGCELIQACDFRIATTRSEFGQPEIRLGLIPGAGGTQRLVKLVGLAKAKELVMLGERINAEEAHRIGLINKLVPPERFEEEVRSFANKLAEMPPIALKAAKLALNYGTQSPLSIGLTLERGLFSLLFSTKDFMEGVSAFLSKRKPEFKGE